MLGWVRVLLLLAVAAASAVPPLPKVSWTVEDAVYFYNEGSNTDYFYQLVETAPENHLNDSARPQQLWFSLMETECMKTENKSLLADCAFKDEGEIKVCSAVYIVDLERNAIVISCDTATPKRTRFQRWITKRRKASKSSRRIRPIRPSGRTNIHYPGR